MAISNNVAPIVFAILAVGQAVRFFQGWSVTIDHFSVPLWASAVAAIALGVLAVLTWRDDGRKRR